jgi:DNA-directed RNA polymerase subunit RPC12/RpoP
MTRNIVQCSRCGTQLDLSAFATGQTVACQCGTQLIVPPPPVQAAQPIQQQQPGPPPGQPWRQPPPGAPPNIPPVSPPMPPYPQARQKCKEAGEALTYAIISIFCLGVILGPVAIVKANRAQRIMQANPSLDGSGKATAAKVIGIITTILGAIGIIRIVAMLATGGSWH